MSQSLNSLKGGCIGDYIREHHRGESGGVTRIIGFRGHLTGV